MPKITIPIKGMHCRSCELIIEGNLKKIHDVKKVNISYKTGLADVYFEKCTPSADVLRSAIKNSGYEIGRKEKLSWFSSDKEDYVNLAKGGAILLLVYFIAKWLGLFELGINTQSTSLLVVLVVGLVAGVSTCMALVGGLVLGLSARHAELHPEMTAMEKFRPHLFFNLGRIVGFAVLGGIIGLIGSAVQLSSGTLGVMTIVVGGVMMFLGLKLIDVFPVLQDISLSLPTGIAKFFGIKKENREYSHKSSFVTGVLTFFLPCGFTQAMQLYAVSTGSFTKGAMVMFLFALGTAPGLLGIGGLVSIFKGKKARIFFAGTGLAVILLGWFNIANGSQLVFQGKTSSGAATVNGVQEVRMTQGARGYSPNQFTIEKGKKVKWIINSETQLSCASSIYVPKLGINKYLDKGENIIEFVPSDVGEIPFSCSMGMYRGKFIVVETGAKVSAPTQNTALAGSGGGCGGGGGGCGGGGGGCGGGVRVKKPTDSTATTAQVEGGVQIIKAQYTISQDISPNKFTVKKGAPARFEIDVKENGSGCMGSIMVPGLYNNAQWLTGGKTLVMEFTPNEVGSFNITCAMGVPRGVIEVVD